MKDKYWDIIRHLGTENTLMEEEIKAQQQIISQLKKQLAKYSRHRLCRFAIRHLTGKFWYKRRIK